MVERSKVHAMRVRLVSCVMNEEWRQTFRLTLGSHSFNINTVRYPVAFMIWFLRLPLITTRQKSQKDNRHARSPKKEAFLVSKGDVGNSKPGSNIFPYTKPLFILSSHVSRVRQYKSEACWRDIKEVMQLELPLSRRHCNRKQKTPDCVKSAGTWPDQL